MNYFKKNLHKKIILALSLLALIVIPGKLYAIMVDVEQVEQHDRNMVYHLTKGTSAPFSVQIPAMTTEYTAEDGSVQYETAYPQITKIKNSHPAIVSYDGNTVTGLTEGTATFKISYEYAFRAYTVKETTTVYVRVVAYSRSGNTFFIQPELIENGDITYSLREASAEARDLATDADHYAIHVPAGNYTLSDVIHLYSNITLDMDKDAVLTMTAKTGYNMFLLGTTGEYMGEANYNESELCAGYSGFKNVIIRGGTLVGNPKNKSCLVRMAHAKNVIIENVTFSGGAGAHQVEVAAIDGFTVKNCVFSDFYGIASVAGNYEALQFDIPCAKSPYQGAYEDGTMMQNVVVTGCTFKNLSKGLGAHTMLIGAYHENIKINGNVFFNITNEAVICLDFYRAEIKDNIMTDCGMGVRFEYYLPNRYCIYNTIFEGEQEYKKGIRHKAESVISGNKMEIRYHGNDTERVGILVYGYNRTSAITGAAGNKVKAQNYYVSDVTVTGNEIVTAGYGIKLQDAKKCTVTDNIITGKHFSELDSHILAGYTYDGIYLTNKSSTVELSGNTIKKMNGGGIYLSSSSALGGIKNNTVTGVKRYGIYLYGDSKTKNGIEGNTIKSTGEAEALIYLKTSAAARQYISGNTLKGYKTNSAIRIDSGNFFINDNKISRVKDGIVIAEGAKGYIYANTCSSKAASRIRIGEKNYYIDPVEQRKLLAQEDALTVMLKKVSNAKGYEIWISGQEDFADGRQTFKFKTSKKPAVIEGQETGNYYYIRAYGYKYYKGVRIYKNAWKLSE